MKSAVRVVLLFCGLAVPASGQQSEFAAGRASYLAGEFQAAAAHFTRALRERPDDAECNYWLGRSYGTLADIARPFGGRYLSRAHTYLSKSVEFAPNRTDFRQELFAFLLDSADSFRDGLPQARRLLLATSEDDPDYGEMARRLAQATRERSSASSWIGRVLLGAPQAAFRAANSIGSAR